MNRKSLFAKPEARFLVLYLLILVSSFTIIALKPVDETFVAPYTATVAKVSGEILRVLGEEMTIDGCLLRSPKFAVTIYNGCNGLITSIIFLAGVLAFPARPVAKIIGVIGGLLTIQVINLVRILSLYYVGVFRPEWFNASHIVVWQSIVILSGVALWVFWATRFASPNPSPHGKSGS